MGDAHLSFGKGKPPAAIGAIVAFAITLTIFFGAMYMWYLGAEPTAPPTENGQPVVVPAQDQTGEVKKFESTEEFRAWIVEADAKSQYANGFVNTFATRGMALGMEGAVADTAVSAPTAAPGIAEEAAVDGDNGASGRVSGTNVQVEGIDEPDILKTDGKEIYYAPQNMYRTFVEVMPTDVMVEGDARIMPPYYQEPSIKAVAAFPPENLKLDSEIKRTGEMLLSDGKLAVFAYDGVYAYDVTDPTAPTEAWKISYQNNSWSVAQRLMDGKLYLVLSGGIDRVRPCPYVPLAIDGRDVSVSCGAIWHPVLPVPTDTTYTILKVDMATGETEATASFVGSYSSTVYMSADNIYVTYNLPPDTFKFIAGYMNANVDLVPSFVRERLNKVAAYDISDEAKMVELREVLGRWMQGLSEDEALKLANEMENRISSYFADHRREVQSTGIVRVSADTLDVQASGVVPGAPLNQFSLDEFDGHLRIATTTSDTNGLFWQFGFNSGSGSISDVYVLDGELNQVGAALGMGQGERIYSVRFIGERGYVVTFRQVDPFYVLDLSNPAEPTVAGELKIPGYSSYLHPLGENLILGAGQEDGQVKLSLFDVSDAANPVEKSKYMLKEYWSDILNTHHAFLMDDKYQVFFLPGSEGGYIFSYAGDALTLTKAVSGSAVRRALFIDDYLYVAGDADIVVLSEKDWSRVNELKFE